MHPHILDMTYPTFLRLRAGINLWRQFLTRSMPALGEPRISVREGAAVKHAAAHMQDLGFICGPRAALGIELLSLGALRLQAYLFGSARSPYSFL